MENFEIINLNKCKQGQNCEQSDKHTIETNVTNRKGNGAITSFSELEQIRQLNFSVRDNWNKNTI